MCPCRADAGPVAAGLGAFRPRVAVAVQRNAGDAKLAAPLPELGGPVPGPHAGQIRKQNALGGQVFEQVQSFLPQMHQHWHAGLFAGESNSVVRPVHVLASQAGNVALARPQVPAKLI